MTPMTDAGRPTRAVRFPPDGLDFALVALRQRGTPFQPDLVALIYDEAPLDGCALVVIEHPLLQPETLCTVRVGRMDPVEARIVWRKTIEPRLVHIGLQYLG